MTLETREKRTAREWGCDLLASLPDSERPQLLASRRLALAVKPTLLIAEPDNDLCETYQRLGEHKGFNVNMASNGVTCFNKLLKTPPHALIVDLALLWGGGEGIVACVREDFADELLPFVLVSGIEPPEIISQRSGIPVQRCFRKPLQPGKVLDSALGLWRSRRGAP